MSNWWQDTPWRMIQTNLRQTDMLDISAERFVDDLKNFGATVVLLNTAGIIASYETGLKYHFQSEYLKGDSLERIVEKCHEAGIFVLARTDFSKVRRPLYEQHPEWAYRTKDGNIVDYNGDVHVCLNGVYQQECMYEIVRECVERVKVDGLFCNMAGFLVRDYSYNYHGICHCGSCRKLFKERFGLNLPEKEDMADPVYRKYKVFQRECVQKHNERLHKYIKGLSPALAMNGYDIVRIESNTEYGRPLPQWQHSGSSNARVIRGTGEKGTVSSNAVVDFIGFYYRHVAVSPPMQELRLWQALANLGGLDYYIIGRLDNHEDRSGYARVKKVFSFHKAHEDVFKGLKSRAEAVLVRSGHWSSSSEERGWIRALTENHFLFDELDISEAAEASLGKYKAVIVPDQASLPDAFVKNLDAFAKKGGIVVCTGESGLRDDNFELNEKPLLECLGVEKVRHISTDILSAILKLDGEDKKTFTHFTDSELVAVGDKFTFTELKPGAKTWMKYIPPHWFGPPERCYYSQVTDIPGISMYPFGKGAGVTIPWLPGKFFHEGGYENPLLFMRGVLFGICGLTSAAPDLTPMAEVTVSEKPGSTVIQLVNASGHFGTSFYEPLPIRDVTVIIRLEREPKSVKSLFTPDNTRFTYESGSLTVTVPELKAYEAVVIE